MPIIQASPSTYDLQRTIDIILVSGSYTLFACLSVNGRSSTALF